MSLNCREIDAVLKEIPFKDSFLQNIRQSGFMHLLFDFFGREGPFTLLVSLKPGMLRLHTVSVKYPSLKTPPRFLQLLRARIKGGKVLSAFQLGDERIIQLELVRNNETFRLYIRLWGGAANLVLTDGDNLILDAFSRRPARDEIPGKIFRPRAEGPSVTAKPFAVRDLPGEESFNRRLEKYYGGLENSAEWDSLAEKVSAVFHQRERKLLSLMDNLKRKGAGSGGNGEFRKWGDLVMANLHRIGKGDKWLEAEAFENPAETVRITLDPELSPYENAEKFYKKQARQDTARRLAEEELSVCAHELDLLNQEREHLLGGEASLEELRAALPVQREQAAGDDRFPGLRFRSGNHLIYVGRTAAENDELLRHHVNGNDLWLHVRDYPGGYVFVKVLKGKSIPLEVLLDAGNLAVQYSKARQAGAAELYYTPVKYLRRAKNGPQGLVLPTREKNLSVRIDPDRLKRLQGG